MFARHRFVADRAARARFILDGQPNPCPDCGQHQWLIGRSTAECACCATALPLDAAIRRAA